MSACERSLLQGQPSAGERPKTEDSPVSDKSLFLGVWVRRGKIAMPGSRPQPGADRPRHPAGERPKTEDSPVSDKSLFLGAWVRRGVRSGDRGPRPGGAGRGSDRPGPASRVGFQGRMRLSKNKNKSLSHPRQNVQANTSGQILRPLVLAFAGPQAPGGNLRFPETRGTGRGAGSGARHESKTRAAGITWAISRGHDKGAAPMLPRPTQYPRCVARPDDGRQVRKKGRRLAAPPPVKFSDKSRWARSRASRAA